jgi:hypothetical protein
MTAGQWLTVFGLVVFLAVGSLAVIAYQMWITRVVASRLLRRDSLEKLDPAAQARVRRVAVRWIWLLKVTRMRRLEELLQSRVIEPTEGTDPKK